MKLHVNLKQLLTAILLTMAMSAGAVLKQNIPVTLQQPDGTKINCFVSGDEFYNRFHDANGYTIVLNQKGYYVYASELRGEIVASEFVVGKSDPLTIKSIKPNIRISEEAYQASRKSRYHAKAEGLKTLHLDNIKRSDPKEITTMNNIVVFIKFSNSNPVTENLSFYDAIYNTSTASVSDYYKKVSYNQFDIHSSFFPTQSGTSIVWYTDSHPRGYYQKKSSSNTIGYDPNASSGQNSVSYREHTLLKTAIESIRDLIPDDLNIDINEDGYVDAVSFVVEGVNDGWSDLLWPHQWSLFTHNVTIDGKRVYEYTFQLQRLYNQPLDLGTLCHEMFHLLGAPDLYHYKETSNIDAIGSWDIMCSTMDSPQSMGAYMKYKYGGWIKTLPIVDETGKYTLKPLTTSPTQNIYRINSTKSSNEFFVVEYRKKEQIDSQLPNEGMLVYRINSNFNGNAQGPPDEVYLYRPNGTPNAEGQLNNAPYSIQMGRTAINDETNPSSFLSNGNDGGLDISNVSKALDSITFKANINYSIPIELANDNGAMSGIGTGSDFDVTAATRFDTQDLSRHVGKAITKIKVHIKKVNGSDVVNGETLKIWSGGNALGAGNEIFSQSIANTITYNNWYTYTLPNPVRIAANTEYWVGYSASATTGYPFSVDNGPRIEGKGLWGFEDGEWVEYTDINGNWCIRAVVEKVALSEFTITASAEGQGSITPSGEVNVTEAQSQQFAISANAGYEIDAVIVDGQNQTSNVTNGVYTFSNVSEDHTINATFKPSSETQYVITASSNGNGTISPTGSVIVNEESDRSFFFTPNAGYKIASVLVDNNEVISSMGDSNVYTFENVNANHSISVSFGRITHTIYTTTDANGTISPSGNFEVIDGDSIVLTIIPNENYKISEFNVDGDDALELLSGNTFTLRDVTSDHEIEALFEPITYRMTVYCGTNGSINPSGDNIVVNQGQDLTFTITANTSYILKNIYVDSRNVIDSIKSINSDMANLTYTFFDVKKPHSISVYFALKTGIDDNNTSSSIAIYPNPATNNLTVEGCNRPTKLQVYSITGVLMNEYSINGTTIIDISGLKPGIYITKIDGETSRFIKQ